MLYLRLNIKNKSHETYLSTVLSAANLFRSVYVSISTALCRRAVVSTTWVVMIINT